MKFGVFDHLDASGGDLASLFDDRLRLCETYDRLGLYGYHVAEHHGTPLGHAPSPSVFLAAVAQRTRRIRLGPLVLLLPLYHPLRLIGEVCMLDQLSRGRLMLGIGRGVSPVESGFFGIDPDEQRAIYDETLDILLTGLTSDRLNHQGRHYRFDDVPMELRPYQRPHPPLWYGARTPESIVWSARNDVNIVTLATAGRARASFDLFRSTWEEARRPADAMPLMGLSRHIVVADSDDEAEAIATAAYARWRESFIKLWRERGVGQVIVDAQPADWATLQAAGAGMAGSPATVAAYVAEQRAQSGCTYLAAWFAFGDMPVDHAIRSVTLFAEQVAPRFTDIPAAAAIG